MSLFRPSPCVWLPKDGRSSITGAAYCFVASVRSGGFASVRPASTTLFQPALIRFSTCMDLGVAPSDSRPAVRQYGGSLRAPHSKSNSDSEPHWMIVLRQRLCSICDALIYELAVMSLLLPALTELVVSEACFLTNSFSSKTRM